MTHAPFCVFADILLNRIEAEMYLLEVVKEGRHPRAIETLMDCLQEAQSNVDTVILSFDFSRLLVDLNYLALDLEMMTLNQLHQALEVRYHYMFPLELAAIEKRMIEGWDEEGATRVRDLEISKSSDPVFLTDSGPESCLRLQTP